ncbi:hypothetical protein ACIG0C_14125 [Kitasatospora aureofaciens]|uniref:Uncharacterized protein n=1 Tax=Kitasatospora aureofaciens TaxID=1894 RepID=A0A1E7N5Y0_KITAU|nr:hypothetical protein [Kitasatospora aureofaciens]QEV01290.1 hypothetical protein CP971_20330 [Streptomyces viridifaciens]ARF80045.1 hypothetical protein B6264_14985 [Kitasatospora aureofaciens]OEV36100.1 hypothetical protein HS99_0031005 [Kitasatospora aureofaciens]UKZ07661.1 hypothetical protein BOQ63_027210 [Streptomyces viridifaciens]GGV02921.1 hypothetical protein GCM10010502_67010 [Kitasatospora aureofaciens]
MTSPTRTTLRRTAGVLFLLALASGCGIRPTAVPVDAGAPASRTACPTAPHIPTALATPTVPAPTPGPARGAAKAGVSPSPSPTPVPPGSPPPDNVFSAVPTSAPCR